ncbi:hypothetical protein EVAR_17672_1 [Eumeta japonica]|uniref:Uncharacterized protein n=1 Tax=Eumeta variegata TaxID=151549 RepID=A0A4C1URQ2_EUMVA|nr:hypothetical protein EVAR_17672_1 [Eumeta japonica]
MYSFIFLCGKDLAVNLGLGSAFNPGSRAVLDVCLGHASDSNPEPTLGFVPVPFSISFLVLALDSGFQFPDPARCSDLYEAKKNAVVRVLHTRQPSLVTCRDRTGWCSVSARRLARPPMYLAVYADNALSARYRRAMQTSRLSAPPISGH